MDITKTHHNATQSGYKRCDVAQNLAKTWYGQVSRNLQTVENQNVRSVWMNSKYLLWSMNTWRSETKEIGLLQGNNGHELPVQEIGLLQGNNGHELPLQEIRPLEGNNGNKLPLQEIGKYCNPILFRCRFNFDNFGTSIFT